jgi:hypothetical protein
VVHGQSIKTTAEHPFYVPAQGKFVAAGELQVGERLVGHQARSGARHQLWGGRTRCGAPDTRCGAARC